MIDVGVPTTDDRLVIAAAIRVVGLIIAVFFIIGKELLGIITGGILAAGGIGCGEGWHFLSFVRSKLLHHCLYFGCYPLVTFIGLLPKDIMHQYLNTNHFHGRTPSRIKLQPHPNFQPSRVLVIVKGNRRPSFA